MTTSPTTSTPQPVRLLALATEGTLKTWACTVQGDTRFELVTPIGGRKARRPECDAILLEAKAFDSADALIWYLGDYEGVMAIWMPEVASAADRTYLAQNLVCRPQVISFVEFNLASALDALQQAATLRWAAPIKVEKAKRQGHTATAVTKLVITPKVDFTPAHNTAPLPPIFATEAAPQPPHPVEAKPVVAIWNLAGGTGKTTIATNLAYSAAQRGIRTLLISLTSPDDTPACLPVTVTSSSHFGHWATHRTTPALQEALLPVTENLSLLPGFRSPDDAGRFFLNESTRVLDAVIDPAQKDLGFSMVVVDMPPLTGNMLRQVLTQATVMILVARPLHADVTRTVAAYRYLNIMAGTYQPLSIYLALNQVGAHGLSPNAFELEAAKLFPGGLPQAITAVPEDAKVVTAQQSRKFPVLEAKGFQRALLPLVNSLIPDRRTQPRPSAFDWAISRG